jgi:hypothetical protein
MTPNSPTAPGRYTEQEQGHWRLAAHGIRWTTLGVGLMALSMVLVLVMSGVQAAISMPRNAGAARGMAGSEIFYQVLLYSSMACSILGFFGALIGLTLSCFTPQPSIARYFALGALAMFSMSHVSAGHGLMLQFNAMQRNNGMGGGMGMDEGIFFQLFAALSSYYFTALAEYFLSIILGICFLLAVAGEFRRQEIVLGGQSFLKMLFGIPVILAALGLSIVLTAQSKNQTTSWLPLVGVVFLGVIYVWMCYSLMKLLGHTHRTIMSEIDPQEWRSKLPTATPAVIDPLAD